MILTVAPEEPTSAPAANEGDSPIVVTNFFELFVAFFFKLIDRFMKIFYG